MLVHCASPKKRPIARPQLVFAPARIVRGNLQKCLKCGGVPRLLLRASVLTGFYPVSKAYPHLNDCLQKGKF